ncbi:hypothetical protein PGT21_021688 [Puccinia graminis f. sp. tritici]|uniref:Uncharacterized protein n=2 Tax=Puccinia graminis f. sp. tritici TaxID=56615 RepID=H6QT60_PUCGT|nr:uncharacterized protein PGTG_22009 [Puccinia graminis f. sp. tritici CRL 75-36-700-3]EHS64011.1 hypothetical protein PGTG_22009 [Puccinia graminis f. sp. tritici CRL 75-36-700-3]KAA1089546.1 hypothetical protein PGT21_021688 [Puccinia graminis f. sp. tritici]KAA1107880.1 hypothetical protein PGTUg99_028759 [Puccinia graminis f. sp. tritici]
MRFTIFFSAVILLSFPAVQSLPLDSADSARPIPASIQSKSDDTGARSSQATSS